MDYGFVFGRETLKNSQMSVDTGDLLTMLGPPPYFEASFTYTCQIDCT